MNKHTKDIQDLMTIIRYASHNIMYTFQDVVNEMTKFKLYIHTLNKVQLENLISESFHTLAALKSELVHYINLLPKQSANKTALIILRDQTFGSKLKNINYANYNHTVTVAFNEFVKGITYFENEALYSFESSDPVYHRNGSCLKKRSEKHTTCTDIQGPLKKSNATIIEKCYIERLVYDNMWTHITQTQQDKAHLEWLLGTKSAYQTCFQKFIITLEIEYDKLEANAPIILHVSKFDDQGKQYSKEMYEKRYDSSSKQYIYPVFGTMEKNDKQHVKFDYFTKKSTWKKVSRPSFS